MRTSACRNLRLLTEFWTSQNSLQLLPVNKLFQIDHTLIIICWRHKSHQHHQSAWPRRNSKTFVQSQIIFTFVFRVIDNSWNWVQRVGCFWFWLTVCAHCNRTVFFVFVHIITVSMVSSQTQNSAGFFDCCFKTFF